MFTLRDIEGKIEESLSFLNNPYVETTVLLFLGLYAAVLAPRVPAGVTKLFNSSLFKIAFFFVAAYLSFANPKIALLLSLGFVFTLQALQKFDVRQEVKHLFYKKPRAPLPVVQHGDPEMPPAVPYQAELPLQSAQGLDFPSGWEPNVGAEF
jgi:hypothetical protein